MTRTATPVHRVVALVKQDRSDMMGEFLHCCGILTNLSLSRFLVVRVSSSWFLVVLEASRHALGPTIRRPAPLP